MARAAGLLIAALTAFSAATGLVALLVAAPAAVVGGRKRTAEAPELDLFALFSDPPAGP